MIEPAVRESRQRILYNLHEFICARRLGLADDNAEERLEDVALKVGVNIAPKSRIDERLTERRSLHPQERVIEDLERHDALHIRRIADHPVQREEGILLEWLLCSDRIEMFLFDQPRKRLLTIDARGHGNPVKMREIRTVEIGKLLLNVKITVEIDVAV